MGWGEVCAQFSTCDLFSPVSRMCWRIASLSYNVGMGHLDSGSFKVASGSTGVRLNSKGLISDALRVRLRSKGDGRCHEMTRGTHRLFDRPESWHVLVPRKDILFAFLCFAAEDAFVQALGALTLIWLVTFLGIYNEYGHGEVLGRSRRVVD